MTELEDRSWFPVFARSYQTAFIGYLVTRSNAYGPFLDHLREFPPLVQPMVDLCSGSGAPAITTFRSSAAFTHLTLSDKFPDPSAVQGKDYRYLPYPVDVIDMDFERGTMYTMFNALHHFSDADKVLIAGRIRSAGATALFVEVLEPSLPCLLKVLVTTTVGTVLFMPFVRPFSWGRLFFTYIIPLNLLTIPFDGIVSVLRSRSVAHYRDLFRHAGSAIQVVRLTGGLTPLVVISIQPEA